MREINEGLRLQFGNGTVYGLSRCVDDEYPKGPILPSDWNVIGRENAESARHAVKHFSMERAVRASLVRNVLRCSSRRMMISGGER